MASAFAALAASQFQRAEAKLTSLVGQFFTYRDRILGMRDRLEYLGRKAEKTGNAQLRQAVATVTPQVDRAYNGQVELEGKVKSALSQVTAIQEGAASTGASTTGMVSLASTLVSLAAQVALHQKGVGALDNIVKTLETKTLSAAEIARLRAGGFSMGMTAATAATIGVGAVVVYFLIRRARR
jgi:hypothetical protein